MAFYGISTAGVALTASDAADTIQFANPVTSTISANTVIALDGSDIIYFGAQGATATASAAFSGGIAASGGLAAAGQISATLHGQDVTYTNRTGFSIVSGYKGAFGTGVQVVGVRTSTKAARSFAASQLYGNAGNDSIYLGDQATSYSNFTVGGGAGNDLIGTFNYVNNVKASVTAVDGSMASALFEAGGGNDSISLLFSAVPVANSTIQGSQGDDTVLFYAASGNFSTSQLLGGGGNDVLNLTLAASATNSTVAGGGGDDVIGLDLSASTGNLILGDALNSIGTFDGNDAISGNFNAMSFTTVQGGGGNDTISFTLGVSNGSNLIQGALGNDVFSGNLLSSDTVQMGAGTDLVVIGSGATLGSTIFELGGDSDTITFTVNDVASGAGTVFGGNGGDLIQGTNFGEISSDTIAQVFGYKAFTESTLSALDTISFNGLNDSTASGSYVFSYTAGGLSLGSFNGTGVSGTDGVAVFSAGFDNSLTARVSAINTSLTTTGGTVTFLDGDNINYLFVQGGDATSVSDDLLIQVESARTAANASLSLAGGAKVTMNLR